MSCRCRDRVPLSWDFHQCSVGNPTAPSKRSLGNKRVCGVSGEAHGFYRLYKEMRIHLSPPTPSSSSAHPFPLARALAPKLSLLRKVIPSMSGAGVKWMASSVKEEDIMKLREAGYLAPDIAHRLPTEGLIIPTPKPQERVVFLSHFVRGLGFPLHPCPRDHVLLRAGLP